jgi:SAM-dependent methyltransferase
MSLATRYSSYDLIAGIYKEYLGQNQVQKALLPIEKLLLGNIPKDAHILDLCCGSGELVQNLLTKGYKVTGLDGSESILHHASENAPGGEFICDDARFFELPPTFHGIVSISGSLTHILNLQELKSAFSNVYASLLDNGVFVFNIYLEAAFQSSWNGSISGDVKDEYAWALKTIYYPEEKIGRLHFTIFQLLEGSWQRTDNTVEEKCYSVTEIRSALEDVGFTEISVYDAERDFGVERDPGNAYFICRKAHI